MNYKKGNIVQITDEKHGWFAILLIVVGVEDHGIRGYIVSPSIPDLPNQVEEIFVKNEQIEVVGDSIIILNDSDETEMTDDVRKGTEE